VEICAGGRALKPHSYIYLAAVDIDGAGFDYNLGDTLAKVGLYAEGGQFLFYSVD